MSVRNSSTTNRTRDTANRATRSPLLRVAGSRRSQSIQDAVDEEPWRQWRSDGSTVDSPLSSPATEVEVHSVGLVCQVPHPAAMLTVSLGDRVRPASLPFILLCRAALRSRSRAATFVSSIGRPCG